MTSKILKQLWNERRSNMWLFVELIIIALFLWQAIDPFCTYTAVLNYPDGLDSDSVYVLYITNDDKYDEYYNWQNDVDGYDRMTNDVSQVYKGIAAFPEVEVAADFNYSPGFSYMRTDYIIESSYTPDGCERRVNIVLYTGAENYVKVFRVKDYFTGEVLEPLTDISEVYISRTTAMEAFGTVHCVGKAIGSKAFMSENVASHHTVKGVYEDIKENAYSLPVASMIMCRSADDCYRCVAIRLKPNVDKDEFVKKLNENSAYKLKAGALGNSNYIKEYKGDVASRSIKDENNNHYFQLFLSSFAIFCAFLGIVSTFWIRTNACRGDIGIMRSIGASKKRIVGQFVTEALMLVTVAFAVALPLLAYHVAVNDFAQPLSDVTNEKIAEFIPFFTPVARFAVITLAAYLVIALTAVLAAVIPAVRACNVQIATALHEE